MTKEKVVILISKILMFMALTAFMIVFFMEADQRVIATASQHSQIREMSKVELFNKKLEKDTGVEYKKVRVVLARIYLDGEISEEIIEETIVSMEDFWAEYSGWELIDQDETIVVFQKKIDDISPLLKFNGYFGISEEGILNIYEGKPSNEKVIQSFFQINTKKLKSHQQQELEKGIPVISRDHYEEVLKTYKKYEKQEM